MLKIDLDSVGKKHYTTDINVIFMALADAIRREIISELGRKRLHGFGAAKPI